MIYYKGEVARDIKPSPLGFNISGMTIAINFQRPNGTTIAKTGTSIDAATGQVKYTTTAADTVLDTAGEWFMQVVLTTAGPSTRVGPIENFYVEEKIL